MRLFILENNIESIGGYSRIGKAFIFMQLPSGLTGGWHPNSYIKVKDRDRTGVEMGQIIMIWRCRCSTPN